MAEKTVLVRNSAPIFKIDNHPTAPLEVLHPWRSYPEVTLKVEEMCW